MAKKDDSMTIAALAERGSASKSDGTSMHVKVCSPYRVYFDETATSISGENATGPFDILPQHHNFITLLEPCELVIARPGRDKQRIKISGGLMHVKSDVVKVFLDV
jgi:F0F1-type ATP synthase epsilon subunit